MKTLIKALLLISFTVTAEAIEYSAGIQHAGFLGDKIIYAGIENETHSLGLDLLLGFSEDTDGEQVDQISLKFRYVPWFLDHSVQDLQWQPIYIGLFLTYTNGGSFFYESESKYPEKNYYDATLRRYGFLVGTAVKYKMVSIYTELAALDKSLESQVVSNGALSWKDTLSASVGLRWNF